MPKTTLSDLTENSSATAVVNALRAAKKNEENAGRIEFFDPGKGHGQGWKFKNNGQDCASGSIPLNKHGAKNLKPAINTLLKAVVSCEIDPD